MTAVGVFVLLGIFAAAGVGAIAAAVVIEIGAHRARRDRVSPLIRARIAERKGRLPR